MVQKRGGHFDVFYNSNIPTNLKSYELFRIYNYDFKFQMNFID